MIRAQSKASPVFEKRSRSLSQARDQHSELESGVATGNPFYSRLLIVVVEIKKINNYNDVWPALVPHHCNCSNITVGGSHIQVECLFLLSEICELINAVFLINQNHTFESNG